MSFTDRWRALVAASRRAPAEPPPVLDVERILAARRALLVAQAACPRVVRIGWFPPAAAAAAVIACTIALGAGLDPLPPVRAAGGFLADLPNQVPRAPEFRAPDLHAPFLTADDPGAEPATAHLLDRLLHGASSLMTSPESSP